MPHENPILNRVNSTEPTSSKLASIEEALTASSERAGVLVSQAEQRVEKTTSLTDVITGAITGAASASQTINLASDIANLKAQNATIAGFEAGGGQEAQIALMTQLKEDRDILNSVVDTRQDILADARDKGGIFAELVSRVKLKFTEDDLANAKDDLVSTANQIAATTGATESFAQVNALTKKTLNEGTIVANQKLLAAQANIEVAKTELVALNSNADAMTALAVADSRRVSNLIQGFRLEGEAEARRLAKERMKFQREQMKFQREKWEVELPAAKVAAERAQLLLEDAKSFTPERRDAARANALAAIKRFEDAVALGEQLTTAVQQGQVLYGTTIEDQETIEFKITHPNSREAYIRLQEAGGSADGIIGNTPFEAKSNIELVAPGGDITQTPGIKVLDSITNIQVQTYKESPDGVPKDPATIEKDFNTTAEVFMKNAANKITTGDTTNPYHAPPMGLLALEMEAVKNDPFYKKVLEPMGMKEINPELIMEAATNGIRSKVITPEEAATGIETIFDSAAAYNNLMQGGFKRLGLPSQLTYNVQFKQTPTATEKLTILGVGTSALPVSIITGGEADLGITKAAARAFRDPFFIVDLMNPVKVKQTLVRFLSSNPPSSSSSGAPSDTASTGTEQ